MQVKRSENLRSNFSRLQFFHKNNFSCLLPYLHNRLNQKSKVPKVKQPPNQYNDLCIFIFDLTHFLFNFCQGQPQVRCGCVQCCQKGQKNILKTKKASKTAVHIQEVFFYTSKHFCNLRYQFFKKRNCKKKYKIDIVGFILH